MGGECRNFVCDPGWPVSMSPLSTSNEEAAYLWITHQHPRHQPTQEEFVSKLLQWQVKEHDDDGEEEIRQVQSGVALSVG